MINHIIKYTFRSQYTLIEINARHNLLSKGITVLELGAVDHSWTKFIIQRIASTSLNPTVVSVHLHKQLLPLPAAKYVQGDIADQSTLIAIQEALQLSPVDLILSDLDAETHHDRDLDNAAIIKINK